jgi:hypothetical protein
MPLRATMHGNSNWKSKLEIRTGNPNWKSEFGNPTGFDPDHGGAPAGASRQVQRR